MPLALIYTVCVMTIIYKILRDKDKEIVRLQGIIEDFDRKLGMYEDEVNRLRDIHELGDANAS